LPQGRYGRALTADRSDRANAQMLSLLVGDFTDLTEGKVHDICDEDMAVARAKTPAEKAVFSSVRFSIVPR
jgi:hypothetical protein